mmetsp:Transcript_23526/g.55748  ORF Transcript_23526/g.55748 Transcript_23526/m.55748 type:complete len:87 (-) Transcript_23526:54-314(-)
MPFRSGIVGALVRKAASSAGDDDDDDDIRREESFRRRWVLDGGVDPVVVEIEDARIEKAAAERGVADVVALAVTRSASRESLIEGE